MNTITSRDNRIYKEMTKLTKRKYRDEMGLYLLEGPKPVVDAIGMGAHIDRIFMGEGCETGEFPEEKIWKLPQNFIKEISTTETSQGVIAVVRKKTHSLENLKSFAGLGDNVLIIDRIQDPGNLGTMVRTAEAAGYKAIILMKGSADVYSPKVVRASAGSLLRVPIFFSDEEEILIELLKSCGKKIIATSPNTDISCFDIDMTEDTALIIGNEGQGVSDMLLDGADIKIRIPMEGSIESLNAAVAAGILMYQSQKTK